MSELRTLRIEEMIKWVFITSSSILVTLAVILIIKQMVTIYPSKEADIQAIKIWDSKQIEEVELYLPQMTCLDCGHNHWWRIPPAPTRADMNLAPKSEFLSPARIYVDRKRVEESVKQQTSIGVLISCDPKKQKC